MADPRLFKDDLIGQIEAEVTTLIGTSLGFSRPIQMRFNELIAGVRDGLAVKVFSDDFAPTLRVANLIASILRDTEGGRGLTMAAVQDVSEHR